MNATKPLLRQGAVALMLIGVAACGPQPMYEWHGYNYELKKYYKNPDEHQKFADALREDIEAAEETGKVPPGLYAEYGYMMLTLNRNNEAITYFRKERDKWPEAAPLMDKVIVRLEDRRGY